MCQSVLDQDTEPPHLPAYVYGCVIVEKEELQEVVDEGFYVVPLFITRIVQFVFSSFSLKFES